MKYYLISVFVTIFLTCSYAQKSNIVETEGLQTDLQKNNIGKIFFTDKKIESSALKHEDFLNSYVLTNKSNLFFIAYFDNSLTNYKHHLSPNISLDSLYNAGNYQFTLFIDGKEIYRSNLLPGAPQAKAQNTGTSLNRPLIDNLNGQGSWSESFWNRFLDHGGDQVLTDGKHSLKMEIRPYVKIGNIKTGDIIASGELPVEVARKLKINIKKIRLNKVTAWNGLAISKEKFNARKIKELKGAINEGVFKRINGIVVLKNGKLLIEEYFNGEDRSSLHDPRSVGKSFASTLTGLAIAEGHIKDENQQLKDFYLLNQFQHFSQDKENTTLQELLTMSSGFDGNDEDGHSIGNEDNMYPTDDWVKFALDLPFQNNLKAKWHYFTAGVILLGDILNKSVPGGLEVFADEKLFKPLDIANYKWQYTPQNIPNTAGSIQMNALDFAKYGQLYKNNGVWNGQQILTEAWVKQSLTKQKQITNRTRSYLKTVEAK